jgi:hypothetical protein
MAQFSGWLLANQWRGPEWQQTGRVMALLDELNVHPLPLVDVGARYSHWALQLKKRFPAMNVISFEPDEQFQPIGGSCRMALSDRCCMGDMVEGSMHVREMKRGGNFRVARFDSLNIQITRPAILKIDTEYHTSRSLLGFGERIKEFDVVVCEMANKVPEMPGAESQQAEIIEFMLANGFRGIRTVFAEFDRELSHTDVAFYRV